MGRTGNELCPVAATSAYMVQRGPGPGPLFKFQDGKPLTRQRFVARAREALTSAGVDCSAYSRHSFRGGAATTAAKCGVSDDKNAWKMEKQHIPAAHQDPKGPTSENFNGVSKEHSISSCSTLYLFDSVL